ncbi:MAG: SDR family oxidoreductase [Chitinophagales bacterium]
MKILLTGANGYIGKRLLLALSEQGHEIHCTVRDKRRFRLNERFKNKHLIHIWECDLLDASTFTDLPTEIDVAFYLVHSMNSNAKKFNDLEQKMAENFKDYMDTTSTQQIIYLSGIVNDTELSKHLQSRYNTETILQKSKVPVTILRAAIIIGSGSASFEIIRDLVEKLPVMIAPKWLNTKCQPISIRDTLNYLTGVMLQSEAYNRSFDIGGPDILTYKQMLLQFAEVRELKRFILTVPVFSPRLSSYWLYFVTSTSYTLAVTLVDSMKNEVIVQNNDIDQIVKTEKVGYKDAVKLAFDIIQQSSVISSWKDAVVSGKIDEHYTDFIQVPEQACFHDNRSFTFPKEHTQRVLNNLWRIGGHTGWYAYNPLWMLRGYLDKLVGGVGLRRGRRDATELTEGDALDFWRVLVADKPKKRLLLFAEMKVPGEAWLEFTIEENGDKQQNILHQKATFRPKGLLGRLYWYSVYPLHFLVFPGMAKGIIGYQADDHAVEHVSKS